MAQFWSNMIFPEIWRLMASGDLNIYLSEKLPEYFWNVFWRAFECIFPFLVTTSKSRVKGGEVSTTHQFVGNPEALQGAG